MRISIRVVFFCLVGCCSMVFGGDMNNCCDSAIKIIELIKEELSLVTGIKDYCGKDVKYKNPTLHKWSYIFDNNLLNDIKIICKEKIPHDLNCGDTILLIVYDSYKIIVEDGSFYKGYWMSKNFPKLKNGIEPGMKKEEVKKIMGTPEFEAECRLQYKMTNDALIFLFKNDSLYTMFYSYISQPCE
ncbi:MAG: hypothetical protein N2053_00710 [Chitinispirillaceae bacterium]|nr:hypothetical protein [Chitinispirillaceae bacterium]